MALEDFEKSLSENNKTKHRTDTVKSGAKTRKHSKHHRHHHRSREDEHRHKRSRDSRTHDADRPEDLTRGKKSEHGSLSDEKDEWAERDAAITSTNAEGNDTRWSVAQVELKRDPWMVSPSALEIDYTQKGFKKPPEPTASKLSKADFVLKIHDNELNKHHLQCLADGVDLADEVAKKPAQHQVDYSFGDRGAQWRMTKLKAVFSQANETGRLVDDIAVERFGDLRAFDDAREEQIELERRETYGKCYVGKEKPSGELYHERKMDASIRNNYFLPHGDEDSDKKDLAHEIEARPPPATTVQMDQTALNRLKAQMLKAKLRGSSDATVLEVKYDNAMFSFANRKEPEVVVLGAMENRMLAGGRKGEVKTIDNKRGRERRLVGENEDMSIEDMVREERRTRNQAGGDGQRFAERIAKDGKFDVLKVMLNVSRHLLTICVE